MNIFRKDDQYIYLDVPYCEFYIPSYYFDSGWAKLLTKSIITLGVFNVGIFEKGQFKEFKILNLPTSIELFYTDIEKRTLDFPGSPNTPCTVIKYIKDQTIMNSYTIENSSNSESYLDLIVKGKLPGTIPYSKVLNIWKKNQELNDVHFGVPSATLEMILAVSYRDKQDMTKKFATRYGSDMNLSEYDYVTANIRKICQYASTFTAMTYEDINSMITTSVNRTRDGKYEVNSPVEKVIKY